MSAEEQLARELYEVGCAGVIGADPKAAPRKRSFEILTESGRAGWIAIAKHVLATRPLKGAQS